MVKKRTARHLQRFSTSIIATAIKVITPAILQINFVSGAPLLTCANHKNTPSVTK